MSATLRYRGEKSHLIELAKNLDAFKKVPEQYTETTEIGGTLSLLSRFLIVYLIYREILYYRQANLVYKFVPDVHTEKIQMHVDITVAMPCSSLSGVDLMDETQQDVFAYGTLQRQDVWWELKPEERASFQAIQTMNHLLREEYHSVADILFKTLIHTNEVVKVPHYAQKKTLTKDQHDACRLYGTLGINKVAGVLHLVGGAQPVIDLFGDHLVFGMRHLPANFSHRINRLSFGQYARQIVQPLEGDEVIVPNEATMVQYFLTIVPTEIQNTFSKIMTYQYSVTESIRVFEKERSNYGSPGIYFKYDWSALKIVVHTDRDHLVKFIIRLCSIISGIVVLSGILNSLFINLQKRFIKMFAPQVLPNQHNYQNLKSAEVKVTAVPTLTNNLLISSADLIDLGANTIITTKLPSVL